MERMAVGPIFSRPFATSNSVRRFVKLSPRSEGEALASNDLRQGTAPDGPPPRSDPNTIVYLAFTSGTTGVPKGVMHSDNTLLANARCSPPTGVSAREAVIYSMSPLSHNLGFGAMIIALAHGGELVLHDLSKGESWSIGSSRRDPRSSSASRHTPSTCSRAAPARHATARCCEGISYLGRSRCAERWRPDCSSMASFRKAATA